MLRWPGWSPRRCSVPRYPDREPARDLCEGTFMSDAVEYDVVAAHEGAAGGGGRRREGQLLAAGLDGQVRFLADDIDPLMMAYMVSINDGQNEAIKVD